MDTRSNEEYYSDLAKYGTCPYCGRARRVRETISPNGDTLLELVCSSEGCFYP